MSSHVNFWKFKIDSRYYLYNLFPIKIGTILPHSDYVVLILNKWRQKGILLVRMIYEEKFCIKMYSLLPLHLKFPFTDWLLSLYIKE